MVDFVDAAARAGFVVRTVGRRGTVIVVGLMGGEVPLPPLISMMLTSSYVGSPAELTELMALAEALTTLDDMKAGRIVGRVVLAT